MLVYDMSLKHAERLRVVGCGLKGKLVQPTVLFRPTSVPCVPPPRRRSIVQHVAEACGATCCSLRKQLPPKSASIAYSSGSDLATCVWFVGVNPLLELFEERSGMRLVDAARPRVHAPTFGWENCELHRMRGFKWAATKSANRGGLRAQTIHSDHRRSVETGMYVPNDPSRLNQEHPTWQTAAQWADTPREKDPAPEG